MMRAVRVEKIVEMSIEDRGFVQRKNRNEFLLINAGSN